LRKWYKYFVSSKIKNNIDDRFLFTNHQLIEDNKKSEDNFNFEIFKKNQVFLKQYNFLKNNLNKNKEVLFLGSSWGGSEYFLKDEYKIIASDIEDNYVEYHKNNTDLNYIKVDMLNLGSSNKKYEQIVVNSVVYLFDKDQLEKCIQNIKKISKPKAKIFVIFKSNDGFLIKLIDKILLPIETYLVYLIKKLKNKVDFLRGHQGFRRNIKDFIKIWSKNNFEYQSIYQDLYEIDFNRLRIVQRLKISSFLSKIFFKSTPYLNILIFKNHNV